MSLLHKEENMTMISIFMPGSDRDQTRVDAVCTYSKEPWAAPLDRVGLYHQVSNKTRGITQLGPYSLDKDSLYVNGHHEVQPELCYNEPPYSPSSLKSTTTQSPGAITEHFTLNFTITNLMFTTDLQTPNSRKFRSAEKIMKRYTDSLLQKSSIGPHFTGCKVTGFRPGKNRDSTGVDTICSYGKGSQVPKFNPAEVYQELKGMTNGITKLGIYSLDNKSLYVNGYNEPHERSPRSTTAAPKPISRNFTLNFTLTNLRYSADLEAPNSRRFLSTVKVMNHYVSLALLVPFLGLGGSASRAVSQRTCVTFVPRSGRHGDDTKVDAVCSYKNNASLARFDREKLYQELSTMTNNVTKLGHYSLDRSSLYVDDFTLTDTAATKKPLMAPAKLGYRLSFRIVNENLTNPDSQSPEYRAAVESITNKPDPKISRAVVERTFQDRTSNTTGLWLGSSYRLQEFSVDTLELSVEAATHKTPLESGREKFGLNFRITNLPYSPELQDSSSQMYQENKEKIEKELEVFRSSRLKDQFVGCTVESFGPVHGKGHTEVASTCTFTLDPLSGTLQEQEVFEELKLLTQGFTRLGSSYELEEQSLVVEGYSPLKTDEAESKRSELQFWAIILICLFTLLGFILLLLLCFLVLSCLRRKSHLYQVQQGLYGLYFPHPSTGKVH
ncbi:hypothetical protein EK904_015225 [Melospiza melodia maxima]|nr:hypothetical protein EK904_015225 [Melospiza melodia maxima]